MLILTRRVGESLIIGDDIVVTVLGVNFVASVRFLIYSCHVNNNSEIGRNFEMPNPVPVVSDISVETLMADPYPSFDRIRDLASAVWLDSTRNATTS